MLPSIEEINLITKLDTGEDSSAGFNYEPIKEMYLIIYSNGDEILKQAAQLEHLEILNLAYLGKRKNNDRGVTDQGMQLIRHLKHIKEISWDHWPLSEASAKLLPGFPKLSLLSWRDSKISDEAIAYAGQCESLIDLRISSSEISDAGLLSLNYLAQLKKLSAESITATKGFQSMDSLESLEILYASRARLDDGGIDALTHSRNLIELWISDTLITDNSIPHLLSFEKLKHLTINDTKITANGLAMILEKTTATELSIGGLEINQRSMETLLSRELHHVMLSRNAVSEKDRQRLIDRHGEWKIGFYK